MAINNVNNGDHKWIEDAIFGDIDRTHAKRKKNSPTMAA